jgi:hypothetical protein
MPDPNPEPIDDRVLPDYRRYNVKIETRDSDQEVRARIEDERLESTRKHELRVKDQAHLHRMEVTGAFIAILLISIAAFLLTHPGPVETTNPNTELADKIIVAVISIIGGYGLGRNKKSDGASGSSDTRSLYNCECVWRICLLLKDGLFESPSRSTIIPRVNASAGSLREKRSALLGDASA